MERLQQAMHVLFFLVQNKANIETDMSEMGEVIVSEGGRILGIDMDTGDEIELQFVTDSGESYTNVLQFDDVEFEDIEIDLSVLDDAITATHVDDDYNFFTIDASCVWYMLDIVECEGNLESSRWKVISERDLITRLTPIQFAEM